MGYTYLSVWLTKKCDKEFNSGSDEKLKISEKDWIDSIMSSKLTFLLYIQN